MFHNASLKEILFVSQKRRPKTIRTWQREISRIYSDKCAITGITSQTLILDIGKTPSL